MEYEKKILKDRLILWFLWIFFNQNNCFPAFSQKLHQGAVRCFKVVSPCKYLQPKTIKISIEYWVQNSLSKLKKKTNIFFSLEWIWQEIWASKDGNYVKIALLPKNRDLGSLRKNLREAYKQLEEFCSLKKTLYFIFKHNCLGTVNITVKENCFL